MEKKKILAFCISFAVVFLMGCHNKQNEILKIWEEHGEILQEGWTIFDSKASTGDTAGGINDAIFFLNNSNLVAWACYNDYNGIAVGFTDSTYGGIIIREAELESAQTLNLLTTPSDGSLIDKVFSSREMPTKEGAGLYAPYYSSAPNLHGMVLSTIRHEIPKVGFPNPEVKLDQKVTPHVLSEIWNKGIVHIMCHSRIFIAPTLSYITKVILVLTCEISDSLSLEFTEDIKKGSLMRIISRGRQVYGITPEFIADHNRENWQQSKPLIWGTFCFSGLGGWPRKMIEAGASAYLGWDWSVRSDKDAFYSCSFYTFMCDTPCRDPYSATVGAYYSTYFPKYWDEEDQRWVHLILAGDPFTGFQEPVPDIGWQVGPFALTFRQEAGGVGFDSILKLSFCQDFTNPYLFPAAGIFVGNAYSLAENVTINPIGIDVVINESLGYANWYYEWREAGRDVKPIFITFTELDLPSGMGFGKVSGFVWGTLYWHAHPIPEPEYEVPFFGSFENISVAKAQFLTQGIYKDFIRNVHIYVAKKKPAMTRKGTSSPSSDKRGRL